jgi:hypothetical protein
VLPAVLVIAWLVPGLPLLLAGVFSPAVMLLISVPLAIIIVSSGLHWMPAQWPTALPGPRRGSRWPAWFGLVGTALVAVGFGVWQQAVNSVTIVASRAPGAAFAAGYWISQHGSLPIPARMGAFGGPHPGLSFTTSGLMAHGDALYPRSLPGLPMLLSGGFWLHGISGAALVSPVLGALAVLAFGGLAGRLAGPQWAPAAALVLAITLPEVYTSRSAFAEPVLQILLFGGLCLLIDSLTLRAQPAPALPPPPPGPLPAPSGPAPPVPPATAATEAISTSPGTSGDPATAAEPAPARPPATLSEAVAVLASRSRAGLWRRAGTQPAAVSDDTVVMDNPLAGARWSGWAIRSKPVWLTPAWVLAGLAGLSLGLITLVRPDGLVYLLPVIPVTGGLWAARRSQAGPYSWGLVIGIACGLVAGYVLAGPYMDTIAGPLRTTGLVAAGLAVVTACAVLIVRSGRVRGALRRAGGRPQLRWLGWLTRLRWRSWLPEAAGVAVVAAVIGLAVRPYVQTVRGHPGAGAQAFMAALQQAQGLRVDPARLYVEDSLYWVIWYIGLPAVLLAGVGLALLTRRSVRALLRWRDPSGAARNWALPLLIIGWGAAVVLWQPETVADQPWASRRLVPLVLPGLVLAAIWAAAWLSGWARSRGAGMAAWSFVSACCVVALLVPTLVTTTGFGLTHRGPAGSLHPVVNGLAARKTNAGEPRVTGRLCGAIGRGTAVVIIGEQLADQLAAPVRTMCGRPVAWVAAGQAAAAQLPAVINGIERAGRRPVLLAASRAALGPYAATGSLVVSLRTTQDPHELTEPPMGPGPLNLRVWLATLPKPPAIGA